MKKITNKGQLRLLTTAIIQQELASKMMIDKEIVEVEINGFKYLAKYDPDKGFYIEPK